MPAFDGVKNRDAAKWCRLPSTTREELRKAIPVIVLKTDADAANCYAVSAYFNATVLLSKRAKKPATQPAVPERSLRLPVGRL
jgi:hypothetical protein